MKLKEKWDRFFREDKFQAFVLMLILLFTGVMLVSVVFRFFGHDEFEHIHSAWYAAGGYLPYVDFFQVHHPLLWFILAPVITGFGETMTTVFIIRFMMAFLSLGSVYIVFRLTRLVTRSREVAFVAALFLLSTVMFVEKGIQVRPDVPQVFSGLLSLYYFLLFCRKKRQKYICLSGLFVSVSFLFLQKSIFLLLAYALVFLYKLLKKEISIKPVALFSIFFLMPQLGLLVYLLLSGSFTEYVLTNWVVPARLLAHFSPHYTLLGLWAENSLLWLLLLAGTGAVIFKNFMISKYYSGLFLTQRRSVVAAGNAPRRFFGNKGNRELRLIIFIAIILFVGACFMRLPFKQNFMLPMTLFCIPAAYFFKVLCFKYKWKTTKKSLVLAVVELVPLIVLTVMIFISNRAQVEKIEFVLSHTQRNDLVYDGDIQFNIFRKDLHYFWYGLKKNKEFATYREITGERNRYADYDIYRLIYEKKPKFISAARVKIEKSGLDRFYKKTKFKDLYIRIED